MNSPAVFTPVQPAAGGWIKRPPRAARATALALWLALGGCAGQHWLARPTETEVAPEVLLLTVDTTAIGPPSAGLVDPEHDPLYMLLLAEFAIKRDQLPLAVTQYVDLSQRTPDAALAERATRLAMYAAEPAQALTAAQRWVTLAPKDIDARQLLAALYIRQGNAPAALAQLQYVLSQDHSSDGVRFRVIAGLLAGEEDWHTTLEVMERLVATRPDDNEALVAYALLALRAEQPSKANAVMQKLAQRIDITPSLALAYVAALQKEGHSAQGLEFLAQVLKRKPKDFALRLLYARLLADSKRYPEARQQFAQLAQKWPDNADVIYALGLLNLQAGELEPAEQNFRGLLKTAEHHDDAAFYLGQIAESQGRADAAMTRYHEVVAGSNYFAAQLRVAVLLSALSKVADARAVLAGMKPENPEEAAQRVMTEAEILMFHHQMDAAMAVYDNALNGVYDMTLLYNRAMLAERLGRLEVLERDLSTIIAREPDNAQALNALGFTLADRTTRYAEAEVLIRRALANSPQDFYILDSMGWVLHRQGKSAEALPYLEQAQRQRDDPEVLAHLSEALWALGRRDEARVLLEGALKRHPHEPKVLEAAKRLKP